MADAILKLEAEVLRKDGIAHGFFGRRGGVSDGIYASLNGGPGSGDARERVEENRRRVAHNLCCHSLVNAHQCHSADAVRVTTPWALGTGPKADGLVTDQTGIALAILTADCAPVLLADVEARVIGAAHAGWRGAIGGVIEATIAQMQALGAQRQRICAAIGPAISQAHYEVGPEFAARFLELDPQNARFFIPAERPLHHYFALEDYVGARLRAAGVDQIEALRTCTYGREQDFFSYRRNTHAGTTLYGRQISAIALSAPRQG